MTQPSTLSPDRLLAARTAVYVVFAMNGLAFAAWASRIPDVKQTLGLTAGELGVTLLAVSLGSILGLPASGWISHRLGAAGSVRIGLASMTVGMTGIGLGVDTYGDRWVVAAGLFALGLGVGVWDVGMNLEGASVERLLGRNIMPRFHAAFSGGTVVSALIGALMAWQQVPLTAHLLGSAVVIVGAGLWAIRSFLPRALESEDGASAAEGAAEPGATGTARLGVLSAWTEPKTLLIGVLTLIAAFTEGTANDWVSVAFVEGYGLPTWAGVLAFATFLSFMTLGRIAGTTLLDRYGRVPTLRVMLVGAGVGSLLVVFGGTPALAYLGAAIWGVGVSLGFPVGMSAAADDPERAAARISVVATIGYTAFIAGPPLLGFLGDHFGILQSLLAVGALLVVALLALPAVREPARSPRAEEPAAATAE